MLGNSGRLFGAADNRRLTRGAKKRPAAKAVGRAKRGG
jgi:hypothetical protein